MLWPVFYHPDAKTELDELPANERVAVGHAVEKLESRGPNLGYPHSSAVRGARNLRELRPRGGRSRWRAFYRQVGPAFVVGSIGPETNVNQRKFDRAVSDAERRIDDVRGDQ
ncbi:type II toxin-antitoxin system RelE/ParE family toxin [Micromonospora inyonensis]|uniref:Phage derived protein Gp49-like n=1 Tax=Micromonospora inyonensis TaxID=47866 RepID=A0A1C6RRX2_9ACTN|nr:Phage derived protein Gp49-like [Micromonospora inyonensis]